MTKPDEESERTAAIDEKWLRRLDVFSRAQTGELEPLAKFLEEGNDLDCDMREWLVAFLRGKIKFKPGNRITMSQVYDDVRVYTEIERLMKDRGLKKGKAIGVYLDRNPDENPETLKMRLRRGKRYATSETKIGPPYK